MSYEIKDFSDIVRAVLAELKIPASDATEEERVKADINEIYINEVVPYKRWGWLRKKVKLEHKPYYGSSALTCTVTPDSTTVTFSANISTSKSGFYFATDSYSEIYFISSHTAGTATATLSSPWTGTASSTATFKIWKDWLPLPINCRETFEVIHNFQTKPVLNMGLQDFLSEVNKAPRLSARPTMYTTDDFYDPSTSGDDETESDRYRILRIFPSVYSSSTTLEVHYIQDVTALSLDGDEPLMPIHDRNILKYGALHLAWARHRNEEAAARNWQLFQRKLDRMAGSVEDSVEKPQLIPSSRYMLQKRGSRLGWKSTSVAANSSASSSPTYLKDCEISTGCSLTGNLTVSSGVTIDGVDISELAADVAVLTGLSSGYIIVGNSSNEPAAVQPTGDVTISNAGVTAIAAGAIVNADINASASIAKSKIETGVASRVQVTNGSGVLTDGEITSTELTYLDDFEPLTSATLTDNTTVTAASWAHASFNSIVVEYSIKRDTAYESGVIRILTDGSNVEYTQYGVIAIGTMGVTFSADISGTDVRLRALQSSTGTNGTMKYLVRKNLNA
jgi:hypothetical protein